MTSVYDMPCPTCGGRIVSTARMRDSTQAPTFCENNHRFVRSEAFKPKLVLEASTRLKVTARGTIVNKVADKVTNDIRTLLLRLGYQVKTEIKRAFYFTRFFKEGDDKVHTYELVGWHGEGIYGNERAILEFYDSDRGSKPVFTLGTPNEANLTDDRKRLLGDEIINYIKRRH